MSYHSLPAHRAQERTTEERRFTTVELRVCVKPFLRSTSLRNRVI